MIPLPALIAFAALIPIAAAQGAPMPPAQAVPVPHLHDPQSGPFIVHLDDQDGVIANAVAAWSGDGLQAFEICYQPQENGGVARDSITATSAVAHALKAHGAMIVVTPDGGMCRSSQPRPTWRGAYVAIIGVARL